MGKANVWYNSIRIAFSTPQKERVSSNSGAGK